MQTRSSEKLYSPKPYQTLKEVRIPSKKRHASASTCPQLHKIAPPPKKQKPSKAVHFDHHNDREHSLPRYKGPFPDDSLTSAEKSNPSPELLRNMSLELEEFLADSSSSAPEEVVEPSPAKAAERDEETPNSDATEERTTVSAYPSELEYKPTSPRMPSVLTTEWENHHITAPTPTTSSPPSSKSNDKAYKQTYLNLKTRAWNWATTYFPPSSPSSPNLEDLCHTSPHLLEYANYISALAPNLPSTTTPAWETLFTTQRPFLTYCILGKMLDVHVFSADMVGATDEEEFILRKADEDAVMDDGFHRQTHRALDISAFLGGTPLHPAPHSTLPSHILPTLSTLQASFLHMLSPLLLPQHPPTKLQQHLSRILLSAASLSLSIRREPSTIYHWHTHPAPGTMYSSTSMHILDRDSVKAGDFWREPTDVRVVTMAGWPSCVAYEPKGFDDGKNGGGCVRVVGRAEVLVAWGAPVEPLAVEPTNWLGPSLRVDLTERLKRRDREERMAVAGSGVAVGAGLAMGWVFQQPWVVDTLKGFVGF